MRLRGLFLLLLLAAGEARAQSDTLLVVQGDLPAPYALTSSVFAALPHHAWKEKDHDGKAARYDGVALADVLTRAGVKFGADMKGEWIEYAVIVHANDGYKATFALTEFDKGFTDRVIGLADRTDGRPNPADDGTLRVVVPGEKRHARWVRQVTMIEVRKL